MKYSNLIQFLSLKVRHHSTVFYGFIVLALVSCNVYENTIVVTDISSKQVTNFETSCQPTNMRFKVSGELNGEVVITLLTGNDPGYSEEYTFREGTIDTFFSGDWYSEEVIVAYTPVSVSNGNLTMKFDVCNIFSTRATVSQNDTIK